MTRLDPVRSELSKLRSDLAGIGVEVGLIRVRRALLRKYDPDQPREPAGGPGSGRWTSGDPSGAVPPADASLGRPDPETTGSVGGTREARTQEGTVLADGTRVLTIRIRPNPQAERLTDWDEQHVVTAPDGASTIIENDGPTQTIRDGDTGEILGRNTWTPDGIVPDAFVQRARGLGSVGSQAVARAIEALGAVFAWRSRRNSRDGTMIFEGPASLYRPAENKEMPPVWAGLVNQRDLDAACPRNAEVQAMADEAAAEIRALGNYASQQDFGNKVHATIAKRVRDMKDENFLAETSFMKSGDRLDERRRGSLRLDVLERSTPSTVCVYDHKTGESGLSAPRALDLAETVQRNFPGTLRMIVIEVRPRP